MPIELDISTAEDWIFTEDLIEGKEFQLTQISPPEFGRIQVGQLVDGQIERWFTCPASLDEKFGFSMTATEPRKLAIKAKKIGNSQGWMANIYPMTSQLSGGVNFPTHHELRWHTGKIIKGSKPIWVYGSQYLGGYVSYQNPTTLGDSMACYFDLAQGNYTLELIYGRWSPGGVIDLFIDEEKVKTVNGQSDTNLFNQKEFLNFTVEEGKHSFRSEAKMGSKGGFSFLVHAVWVYPA